LNILPDGTCEFIKFNFSVFEIYLSNLNLIDILNPEKIGMLIDNPAYKVLDASISSIYFPVMNNRRYLFILGKCPVRAIDMFCSALSTFS
jgi:hypothetical protein